MLNLFEKLNTTSKNKNKDTREKTEFTVYILKSHRMRMAAFYPQNPVLVHNNSRFATPPIFGTSERVIFMPSVSVIGKNDFRRSDFRMSHHVRSRLNI